MKVSELEGALLDYWVAKAEGTPVEIAGGDCHLMEGEYCIGYYSPSTDWADGGPIIEREKIDTAYCNVWYALHNAAFTDERQMKEFSGATPLIAAMRCFVASKYGEEVPHESI